MSYRDTLADTIMGLLQAAFGTNGEIFKAYYYGDPIFIPAPNLPALMVQKQRTAIGGRAPTGMERLEHTIAVKIAFDKKAEMGKDPSEVPGQRRLEELAEGIDSATGEFTIDSVAGILRRNFTLVGAATGQELDINYETVIRDDRLVTDEVEITCTIEELLTITNRQ